MQRLTPARVATGLNVIAGVAGAISIPVANMDTTSLVGVLGGLASVTLGVQTFLKGQRAHEARNATTPVPVTAETATFDPGPFREQVTDLLASHTSIIATLRRAVALLEQQTTSTQREPDVANVATAADAAPQTPAPADALPDTPTDAPTDVPTDVPTALPPADEDLRPDPAITESEARS